MTSLLKLIKVLNANHHPGPLALSLTLGMVLGLTPLFFPHTLIIVLLIVLLRVHLGSLLVAWGMFSGIAYALDPVFHQIGLWLLYHPELVNMWTQWYNDWFWRAVSFNNTLVLGSLVVAYLLALPFGLLCWGLINVYRQKWLVWAQKFKVVQMLKVLEKGDVVTGVMK